MRYFECRVIYVDTDRNMLDAISIDQFNYFTDVGYTCTGQRNSGDLYHPELGDTVVIRLDEEGQAKFDKFYAARRVNNNALIEHVVGKATTDKLLPGDRIVSGPDGAILKLLRGGYAALGASPLAQTIYLALEGMVRTVAQNYEVISSGTRIYSVNNAGTIITRLCFNSSEKFFTQGANKNEGTEGENFEFQIDFSSDGFTFYAGNIGDDGKRTNNLIINIKQSGDLEIISGNNIVIDLYSNGGYSFKMVDDSNNIVYNKTIATSSGTALIKEIIKGDLVRYIDGNLIENITGNKNTNANIHTINATVIDHNSTCNRNSTGINIDEIGTS